MPKIDDYRMAVELAIDKLSKADIRERTEKAGGDFSEEGNRIELKFLNTIAIISLPDFSVAYKGIDGDVPIKEKIVILHYLLKSDGTPLSNRLIAFREIKDGAFYYPAFSKRAIGFLKGVFARYPQLLFKSLEYFTGSYLNTGDFSVIINALPNVPVSLVLWKADEEFGMDGNILFDASICHYLDAEDVAVLSETLISRINKLVHNRNR